MVVTATLRIKASPVAAPDWRRFMVWKSGWVNDDTGVKIVVTRVLC